MIFQILDSDGTELLVTTLKSEVARMLHEHPEKDLQIIF